MTTTKFVICMQNTGYEVSLELRKLYQVLPDAGAKAHDQIRVVDESGEDYLYPSAFFAPVDLPDSVAKRVAHAALSECVPQDEGLGAVSLEVHELNEYPAPIMSALCQSITCHGKTVQIDIYEDGANGWLLEVIDEYGNSTVWDDPFITEQHALDEVLKTIKEEGIGCLIGHLK